MEMQNQNHLDSTPHLIAKPEPETEETSIDKFVTVVSVGTERKCSDKSASEYERIVQNENKLLPTDNGFVTVLTIGNGVVFDIPQVSEIVEEVLLYRLPGERLGFGLKFEGGTKTTECVRRLFIQSCAPDSPASRVRCSWGSLQEGDELLQVDSHNVTDMTRIDCVRCLKDSNVVIKLLVKHYKQPSNNHQTNLMDSTSSCHYDEDSPSDEYIEEKIPPPPPIPPRKTPRKLLSKNKYTHPMAFSQDFDLNNAHMTVDNFTGSKEVAYTKINEISSQIQPLFSRSIVRPRHFLETPVAKDRLLSDASSSPLDAEVYLDLLSQELEYGIKAESESDDTGSTISTVIDKHNFILQTSNTSSIASDSLPTTPTAVQKQMDISKVVNPFEILKMEYTSNIQSNENGLCSRFVTSHDILFDYDNISDIHESENDNISPLSYGNNDETTNPKIQDSSFCTNANLERNLQNIVETKQTICDDKCIENNEIIPVVEIPKPVPRKCYLKKTATKDETENMSNTLPEINHNVSDNNTSEKETETANFNLPRLIKFVPKITQKHSLTNMIHNSFNTLNPETNVNYEITTSDSSEPCFDFWVNDNSLKNTLSEIGENNNNECKKNITSSNWSLSSNLATIGETDEEFESFEFVQLRHNSNKDEEQEESGKENIMIATNGDADSSVIACDYNHNTELYKQHNYMENHTQLIVDQCIDISHRNDPTKRHSEIDESLNENEIIDTMQVTNLSPDELHVMITSEYSSLSSLSSPPLSFASRLPPDGEEFPSICQESLLENDLESIFHLPSPTKISSLPHDSILPSLFNNDVQKRKLNDNQKSSSLNHEDSEKRYFLWKRDERSACNVKDKIAIFSSSENALPVYPQNKLNKTHRICTINNGTRNGNSVKKNRHNKSYLCANKMKNEKLDWQNMSANDRLTEFTDVVGLTSDKELDDHENNNELLNFSLSPSNSFSDLQVHSSSMVDITRLDSQQLHHSTNLLGTYNRRNTVIPRTESLNALIKHSRRGISKLRGLVIPQKEVPVINPLLDLPVITSRESTILNKQPTEHEGRDVTDSPVIRYQRTSSCSGLSSRWKINHFINTLPRYSPAFKRKCLQLYVMDQSSPSSSSQNSSSQENASPEVIKNDNTSNDSIHKNSVLGDKNETRNEHIKHKPLKVCRNTDLLSDSCEFDNSDNDSAVSSSPSSYMSRAYSLSPSQEISTNLSDNNINIPDSPNPIYVNHLKEPNARELHVVRTFSNNSGEFSSKNLKTQSLETINRKNILASAKCRSGQDSKEDESTNHKKYDGNDDQNSSVCNNVKDTVIKSKKYLTTKGENSLDNVIENCNSKKPHTVTDSSSKSENKTKEITQETCEQAKVSCIEENNAIPKAFNKQYSSKADKTESKIPANREDGSVDRNMSKNLQNVNLQKTCVKLKTTKLTPVSDIYTTTNNKVRASNPKTGINKIIKVTDIRKQFETDSGAKTSYNYHISKKGFSKNNVEIASTKAVEPDANSLSQDLKQQTIDLSHGIHKNKDPHTNESDILVVVLHRETVGGSIGITLTGGTDYEAKEITVHKVLTGSIAHKDGRLKKGARVLSINGKKMLGLTHKQSVEILKDPRIDVTLVVSLSMDKKSSEPETNCKSNLSNKPNDGAKNQSQSNMPISAADQIVVVKDGAGLGFSLDGGHDSPNGDRPLVIKKIFTGGAAEKCGQLQAGDELLAVNEKDVRKMTRIEVWSSMKRLPDGNVTLTIRR